MTLRELEEEKEALEIASKNPTPEQVQAFLEERAKLKEEVKKNPQLAGIEHQNMNILGAILFASTSGCQCKACQLLAGMAEKSVEFMVDGLIKQKEAAP